MFVKTASGVCFGVWFGFGFGIIAIAKKKKKRKMEQLVIYKLNTRKRRYIVTLVRQLLRMQRTGVEY